VVLSRGSSDGVVLTGNDGTLSVATDPAPASGSRVDVVYVLHRDVDNGDADSGVEVGVAIGDVSGTPTTPSIPTGALALAGSIVSAADLSTFDSQIEQMATYTSVAGGDLHVPFGVDEFSMRIPDPVDGMRVWSDAENVLYVRVDGAWEAAWRDTGWINLSLDNGWEPAGDPPQYRATADTLYLRGRVTGGSGTIAECPVGPSRSWNAVIRDGGSANAGTMLVTSGGTLSPASSVTNPNIDCVIPLG
jgi:hypothetical protein